MELRELGALLKAERERQGLSDNDVIDRIKIGRACLTAIEEGDQSGLPHPVYAKGFIKNYAKLLGLDPEELGEAFSLAAGVVQESNIMPQHELHEPVAQTTIRSGDGGYLRYILVAAAILLVVVGALWFFSLLPFDIGRPTPPAPSSGTSLPAAGPGVLPGHGAQAGPGNMSGSATEPKATGQSALEPGQESAKIPAASEASPGGGQTPLPSVPSGAAGASESVSSSPVSDAAGADAEEPADPSLSPDVVIGEHGAHHVTIVALAECWIDVSVDGGITKGIMLTKGKRFVGRFNESLLIRLGNAGDVEISYDDKEYPLQAASGEVKTLKFVTKTNGEVPQAHATSLATQVPVAPKTPAGTPPAALPAVGTVPTTPPAALPTVGTVPTTPPAVPDPATGAKPAEDATSRPAGSRSLDIVGADGSWVIITADGGKSREVFIKKGQTLTEPYKEKIEVRLGNPSSVVFRHEGQEMPVSTQRGEVKTVRFPTP